jgi:hypothetical protein
MIFKGQGKGLSKYKYNHKGIKIPAANAIMDNITIVQQDRYPQLLFSIYFYMIKLYNR